MPKRLREELVRTSLPEDIAPDSVVELVIRVDDTDVNLRELSAYLELADRSFGRLMPGGISSYSRRRPEQLTASFERGSLDIVIQAIIENEAAITGLVVLRFLLKYVPVGLKDMATAYREIEETRYTRARRKQLRERADVDDELSALKPKERAELVRYFDLVYVREKRTLPAARRFALRHVRELFFRVRKKG
ncbi:MAG: hypothetical protein AAF791_05565 [Bacteroidota bacterium]